MKASTWTAGLTAAAALAASGVCIADVGIADGKDHFTDFRSSKTRAEVQQEYRDARSQGTLQRGEFWTPETASSDIGSRGPAGARYRERTREDVMEELRQYKQTHNPNDTRDIYFGG